CPNFWRSSSHFFLALITPLLNVTRLSFRPEPKAPAQRETEARWRNPENAGSMSCCIREFSRFTIGPATALSHPSHPTRSPPPPPPLPPPRPDRLRLPGTGSFGEELRRARRLKNRR